MKAQEKASCNTVITKCDKALSEKNEELKLSDLAITKCKEANGSLLNDKTIAEEKLNSWYHNPIVVGVLGVLAGAVAIELIKK